MAVENGEEGKQSVVEAYQAIGYALTCWAYVEQSLVVVLARAVTHTVVFKDGAFMHDGMANTLFFAVDNYRPRMMMVDAAVLAVLGDRHPELKQDWEKLRKRADRSSLKRNELAHRMVVNVGGDYKGVRPALKRAMGDHRPDNPRSTNDILDLAESFRSLSRDLAAFGGRLSEPYDVRDRVLKMVNAQLVNYELNEPEEALRVKAILADRHGINPQTD